ncbi:hypothetical protein N836_15510 [Leptolyngbya sp. Heron Island J]|uniref:hypothetical protein n=1 Tax=Leptolyngbya sp. Heron Island J TaxID=1385935 RepID=UPI0003B946B4|nr:hypothetical protein [Leptolyngbya sp. Heron Island J]ESA34826.1 hypothetical protein N836_15510 [Leptolyngbya sp. Heron Island J]
MTRLPRQPLRVKPPLRGRAATKNYRGEFAPIASVRYPQRPYGSPLYQSAPSSCPEPPALSPPVTPPCPPPKRKNRYADLLRVYRYLISLIQTLKQSWPWLIVLALIVGSLLLLNQLL